MKRQWWCRCGATEDDTSVIRRDLCLFFLLSSAIVVPFDRSTQTRTPGIGEAFTVSQLQFPPLLWYIITDGVCLCRIHKPGSLSLSHGHTHRHTHTDGPWFDQITEMPLRGKNAVLFAFAVFSLVVVKYNPPLQMWGLIMTNDPITIMWLSQARIRQGLHTEMVLFRAVVVVVLKNWQPVFQNSLHS